MTTGQSAEIHGTNQQATTSQPGPRHRGKTMRETDSFVAQRVRVRRTELGLSMQDLATALGVSYQQVQKYERGTNRISAGTLSAIASRLGVPVSYFFGDIGRDQSRADEAGRAIKALMTPQGAAVAAALLELERQPRLRRRLVDEFVIAAGLKGGE